jgi:hypothetical protein
VPEISVSWFVASTQCGNANIALGSESLLQNLVISFARRDKMHHWDRLKVDPNQFSFLFCIYAFFENTCCAPVSMISDKIARLQTIQLIRLSTVRRG